MVTSTMCSSTNTSTYTSSTSTSTSTSKLHSSTTQVQVQVPSTTSLVNTVNSVIDMHIKFSYAFTLQLLIRITWSNSK